MRPRCADFRRCIEARSASTGRSLRCRARKSRTTSPASVLATGPSTDYADSNRVAFFNILQAGVGYARPIQCCLVGGSWADNWSGDVEYITDTGSGANFTFDSTKMALVFETQVELDQPFTKTNPVGGRGDFYLTNGDIILVTMTPNSVGSDDVSITIEFGSEK